jgi:hypothetical protein
MNHNKLYNIFLSHSWKYQHHYDSLIARLRENGLMFRDYSVPESDPITGAKTDEQLYAAIEAQIRQSSVVLFMAGVYASHSKWISKELEIAQRYGKKIIAIEPLGAQRTSCPVRAAAIEICSMHASSVINAIRKHG